MTHYEADKPKCGSCIHCEQGGSSFVRKCDKMRASIHIIKTPTCKSYESLWDKDLFGETNFDKLYKDNFKVYYSKI